jgi:hypothetical protein
VCDNSRVKLSRLEIDSEQGWVGTHVGVTWGEIDSHGGSNSKGNLKVKVHARIYAAIYLRIMCPANIVTVGGSKLGGSRAPVADRSRPCRAAKLEAGRSPSPSRLHRSRSSEEGHSILPIVEAPLKVSRLARRVI